MLKQDKSFRLPKSVKRTLATMSGMQETIYRKLMIRGIIIGSAEAPKEKKKQKTIANIEVSVE
jgi:hypothetical protein